MLDRSWKTAHKHYKRQIKARLLENIMYFQSYAEGHLLPIDIFQFEQLHKGHENSLQAFIEKHQYAIPSKIGGITK